MFCTCGRTPEVLFQNSLLNQKFATLALVVPKTMVIILSTVKNEKTSLEVAAAIITGLFILYYLVSFIPLFHMHHETGKATTYTLGAVDSVLAVTSLILSIIIGMRDPPDYASMSAMAAPSTISGFLVASVIQTEHALAKLRTLKSTDIETDPTASQMVAIKPTTSNGAPSPKTSAAEV